MFAAPRPTGKPSDDRLACFEVTDEKMCAAPCTKDKVGKTWTCVFDGYFKAHSTLAGEEDHLKYLRTMPQIRGRIRYHAEVVKAEALVARFLEFLADLKPASAPEPDAPLDEQGEYNKIHEMIEGAADSIFIWYVLPKAILLAAYEANPAGFQTTIRTRSQDFWMEFREKLPAAVRDHLDGLRKTLLFRLLAKQYGSTDSMSDDTIRTIFGVDSTGGSLPPPRDQRAAQQQQQQVEQQPEQA